MRNLRLIKLEVILIQKEVHKHLISHKNQRKYTSKDLLKKAKIFRQPIGILMMPQNSNDLVMLKSSKSIIQLVFRV